MCDEILEGRVMFYDWPRARLYNPETRSFLWMAPKCTVEMLRIFCETHRVTYREVNPLPSPSRGTWAIVG
jgi:hypothetical protein